MSLRPTVLVAAQKAVSQAANEQAKTKQQQQDRVGHDGYEKPFKWHLRAMLWRGSAEPYPLQTIGQFIELVGDIQQPPSPLRAHTLSLPSQKPCALPVLLGGGDVNLAVGQSAVNVG